MAFKTKFITLTMVIILASACNLLSLRGTPTPPPTQTFTPAPTLTSTSTYTPTHTPQPTLTFTPTLTSTPTATPLPTIVPPDPPTGDTSNVYGRVLWRGQPVPYFWMRLHNLDAEERQAVYIEGV